MGGYQKDSLDLYIDICHKARKHGYGFNNKDDYDLLFNMIQSMSTELTYKRESRLLTSFIYGWAKYYRTESEMYSKINKYKFIKLSDVLQLAQISTYDIMVILDCLNSHVSGCLESIIDLYKNTKNDLFRNNTLSKPNKELFYDIIQNIDDKLLIKYETANKKNNKSSEHSGSALFGDANNNADDAQNLIDKANEEAKAIRENAESESNTIKLNAITEAKKIIDTANEDAKQIVSKAETDSLKIKSDAEANAVRIQAAAKYVLDKASISSRNDLNASNARNRRLGIQYRKDIDTEIKNVLVDMQSSVQMILSHITGNIGILSSIAEKITITDINDVMQNLLSCIINIRENFMYSNTQQICKQLIPLYNLISDSNNKHLVRIGVNRSEDYKELLDNCEEYLEYISDIMCDFGAEVIRSHPKDSFDNKLHEVENQSKEFNPKTALILRSIRDGFIFQNTVLQKELVSLM